MNFTSKIILDQRRPKADNTCPVRLRVYKNTDYKELTLGINVKPGNWDSVNQIVFPSDINNEAYNAIILSKKSKLQKLILLAELNEQVDISLTDVITAMSNDSLPGTKAKKESISIIKYGQELIKQLTNSGKVGNAFVYGCAVSKLKSFVGTDNFPFEALTYKKLVEFQDSMLTEKIKINSISVYMRTIRAIYNRAIKEDIVPVTAYPFTAYRVKNEKTVNRTLSIKEMQSIIKLKLTPDTPIWHWRNYFMLSFCLIGINFADLLTLTGDNIVETTSELFDLHHILGLPFEQWHLTKYNLYKGFYRMRILKAILHCPNCHLHHPAANLLLPNKCGPLTLSLLHP